jgi:hypothetical protein
MDDFEKAALAMQLRKAVTDYRAAWWPTQIAMAFKIADLIERNIASVEDALHRPA